MAGKDMPSLEVRAGRGGRPPLSSRDRELGCDGSSGAILLIKRLPCEREAFSFGSSGGGDATFGVLRGAVAADTRGAQT